MQSQQINIDNNPILGKDVDVIVDVDVDEVVILATLGKGNACVNLIPTVKC